MIENFFWSNSILDLLTAIGAIGTLIVALIGLNTWKKQYFAKLRVEPCVELLTKAFIVRNKFEIARSRLITAMEMPETYRSSITGKRDPEKDAEMNQYVFKNRFKPVEISVKEMISAAIRPEVLIGPEVKFKTREIISICNTLYFEMEEHVENIYHDWSGVSPEDRAKSTRQCFGKLDDSENELSIKFNNALNDLEKLLQDQIKKHLL